MNSLRHHLGAALLRLTSHFSSKRRLFLSAALTALALLVWGLWSGSGAAPDGAAPPVPPALAATDAEPEPEPEPDGETFSAPPPPPTVPGASPVPAPAQPAVAAQKPTLGVPLVPYQPAGKAFDPRFVQPATRMGLVGVRTPEVEREIREDEAKVTAEKAAAIAWAKANGWPIKGRKENGGYYELMRLGQDGQPEYYETQNHEARISHNVEPVTQFGPLAGNLSGAGWLAGMWEPGPPRLSHIEFNDFPGRVVYAETRDSGDSGNEIADHATHVMGTILGNGFADSRARGMAWRASALCYGWNNDFAEMRNIGATAPAQPSRVYVSNHSYAPTFGWRKYQSSEPRAGSWRWIGGNGATESEGFGRYWEKESEYDKTCRLNPYLLPFMAAGNARGLSPSFLDTVYWNQANGTETSGTWGLGSGAPPANGDADDGYDTLSRTAKNPMVVGNMEDAVSSGQRSTSGVTMVSSSSYGPTDDGRIKPDIVANGDDVLSATFNNDTATAYKTGTSMASPGATGTGLLLHEHYFAKTGQYLRASTLKALMIHTATDVLASGPDYASGWGLIDAVAAVQQIDLHAAEPGGFHIVEGVLSAEQPEFRVSFAAADLIKTTLSWTDPEGSDPTGLDNRTKVLVNDLDITLRAPNGTIYRSPQLDPLAPTAAPTYNGNNTDNVEMLFGYPLSFFPFVLQPGVYELAVTYKGNLTEPDVVAPAIPKQVFSLMLKGNAAATTGTMAEAVDKPARIFTKHAAATAAFAFEPAAGAIGGDRAANLDIADTQTAGMETKVTGPVTMTFTWGVDSEQNFDFLRFYSNGIKIQEISGSVTSTAVAYNVPAGTHTLRWSYEKDSSVSTGTDKGWIDNMDFNNVPEAVDNLALTFTQPVGSSATWTLLATPGNSGVPTGDVAQAGNIAALQRSDMETIIQGPALVRFRMVQNGTNGELRAQWGPGLSSSVLHSAGNVWKRYSIEIPAGPQSVRWSWYKPAGATGAGYVDELEVTPMPSSLRDAVDLPGNAANLVVANYLDWPWLADTSDAAPSGPLGERGISAIRTIQSPGTINTTSISYPIISNTGGVLSFWWQASGSPTGNMSVGRRFNSTAPFNQAGPSVGPRFIAPITGGTGWQQVHMEIPPGYYEVQWVYNVPSGQGQGWLDQIEFQEGLLAPARGLDRWGSRWENYGHSPWAGVHDTTNTRAGGFDSTSHGDIVDGQSTSLTTTVTGPKRLQFDWKVSSEANYDFLRFFLDGEEPGPGLSGESGWQSVSLDIPAGTHVLRWEYSKDGSFTNGQDRGWIDQVALLRGDFGFGTGVRQVGDTAVSVPVRKDPTAGFFLEQSSDLVNWIPAGTGTMLNPRFTDVNVIVPNPGNRGFYRLIYKPELVHNIENASFELPVVSADTFNDNGPGWGPDNDGFAVSVFERLSAFAPAAGGQHFSLAAGSISEMKTGFIGWRGVHSVTASVGHRPGWTAAGNYSSVILTTVFNNIVTELDRTAQGAAALPTGTWHNAMPATWDSFETNLDATYTYKVRLQSVGTRSYFDNIRVVSEPQ